MNIKLECNDCESEDIHIDLGRHMIWCNGCGETQQMSIREYDWIEGEE